MFIDKEPQKAVDDLKAKKALDKEPVAEIKSARKEGLKGLPYEDQVKATSMRDKKNELLPRAPEGVAGKDPIGELKNLFSQMGLCERFVPNNVVSYDYEPKSGALVVHLAAGFSKQFDAENTVTFGKTISGTLKNGSFSGVSGITRGSATIVEISRKAPGVIAIRGKMGPFSKSIEFKDDQIPSLP